MHISPCNVVLIIYVAYVFICCSLYFFIGVITIFLIEALILYLSMNVLSNKTFIIVKHIEHWIFAISSI